MIRCSIGKLSIDNDANATWIGSLASYWGGIIGGVFSGTIAIFGVFYTIQFTREADRKKERQSIQPFLNVEVVGKPSGTVKKFQIADEPKYVEGKATQEFYPIYLSITNIGNGFANTLTFGTGENLTGISFKEVFTVNQKKEILLNVQTYKMGKRVTFFIWFADSMTNEYIQYYELKRNEDGILLIQIKSPPEMNLAEGFSLMKTSRLCNKFNINSNLSCLKTVIYCLTAFFLFQSTTFSQL